jgi:hypothetical protein
VSRRDPVEVVIVRNGHHGPLHLAIPIGGDRWAAACRLRDRRRILTGEGVRTWGFRDPCPWLEVRTCGDCADLGERARDTIHLAQLAGWTRPQ